MLPRASHTAERTAYVSAMGAVATGVSIVSTDGPAGQFAMTVSAFSSVSADPPTVLACINRRSPLVAAVRRNGVFCVSVLGAEHAGIADRFAGRPRDGLAYDFSTAAWGSLETGAPYLAEAVAAFDCELDQAIDQGSHLVVFGRVVAVASGGSQPLVYARRTYGRPQLVAAE
jgi:flavin reductase